MKKVLILLSTVTLISNIYDCYSSNDSTASVNTSSSETTEEDNIISNEQRTNYYNLFYKMCNIKDLLHKINKILNRDRPYLEYIAYDNIKVESSMLHLLKQGTEIYYKYIKDNDEDVITNDLYRSLLQDASNYIKHIEDWLLNCKIKKLPYKTQLMQAFPEIKHFIKNYII